MEDISDIFAAVASIGFETDCDDEFNTYDYAFRMDTYGNKFILY